MEPDADITKSKLEMVCITRDGILAKTIEGFYSHKKDGRHHSPVVEGGMAHEY